MRAKRLYDGAYEVEPADGSWLDPCGAIYVTAVDTGDAISRALTYLRDNEKSEGPYWLIPRSNEAAIRENERLQRRVRRLPR